MKRRSFHPIAAQAGFGLIELMVALTIGLFICLSIGSIFISVKQTFIAQNGLGQLQDSERMVLTVLRTTTQEAGYFPDPQNETSAQAFPASTSANSDGTTFLVGQSISGTSSTGSGSSDTINIRYVSASGSGLMNCLGGTNTSSGNATWINSYAVNTSHQLTCSVNGATPVPLVDNISSLSILYGVDSGSGQTDTYMTADQVSAAGLWSNVHTVQFSLSFLNPLSTPGTTSAMPSTWVQTISVMGMS
jgi:type IV pilus assembly protein PilW